MKKNCLIKLLHPECGKCVAAPAPLSEALSVQWPECEKLHLAQIFEEVVLKERVLVVEEALHLPRFLFGGSHIRTPNGRLTVRYFTVVSVHVRYSPYSDSPGFGRTPRLQSSVLLSVILW